MVHDLRVIDGRNGFFVAMPSRKLSDNCPRCGGKNHLTAKFCSECGAKLEESRAAVHKGRDKLHVDVAHPINPACRQMIQSTVLKAFEGEADKGAEQEEPARGYEREQLDELADELSGAAPDEAAPESKEPEGREPEPAEPESKEPEGHEPEPAEPESKEPEGPEAEPAGPESKEPEGPEPEAAGPESKEPEGPEPEAAPDHKPEAPGEQQQEESQPGGFGDGIL